MTRPCCNDHTTGQVCVTERTVTSTTNSSRRSAVWILRIAAIVIVCVGVGGTIRGAFAELSKHEWELRPGWLAVSATVFLLGLLPMAWFWHRTLAVLGYPTPFPPVI